MKRIKNIPFVWVLPCMLLAIGSCSSGGDDGDEPTPDDDIIIPPIDGDVPSAAALIFPEENEACNEGVIINEMQSRVTFQWSASENTDSYEVNLRDLNTNAVEVTPSNTNESDIVLARGTPYEWFVVSKADNSNATTESAKWKFYNQGLGIEHYAPFPAEAINPTQGQTVNSAGAITLQWNSSDVDNDIVEYEVAFGTSNPPTTILVTTVQNNTNTTVVSGQTYYWRVTTKDSQDNSSQSEIFQFIVL